MNKSIHLRIISKIVLFVLGMIFCSHIASSQPDSLHPARGRHDIVLGAGLGGPQSTSLALGYDFMYYRGKRLQLSVMTQYHYNRWPPCTGLFCFFETWNGLSLRNQFRYDLSAGRGHFLQGSIGILGVSEIERDYAYVLPSFSLGYRYLPPSSSTGIGIGFGMPELFYFKASFSLN